MMEAQLILATLIQRVTFELMSGQRIEPEPLHPEGTRLRPKGGVGWWYGSDRLLLILQC